eukprot:1369313-Pleurochrysis_carterae.AAC.1
MFIYNISKCGREPDADAGAGARLRGGSVSMAQSGGVGHVRYSGQNLKDWSAENSANTHAAGVQKKGNCACAPQRSSVLRRFEIFYFATSDET